EVGGGESGALEAAGGGLAAGAFDRDSGDVQAVGLPALLGQPQHVPAFSAAQVDRAARWELADDGCHGGVDLPGPHALGVRVALFPVVGGGEVLVGGMIVMIGAVLVRRCHAPSTAEVRAVRQRSCAQGPSAAIHARAVSLRYIVATACDLARAARLCTAAHPLPGATTKGHPR